MTECVAREQRSTGDLGRARANAASRLACLVVIPNHLNGTVVIRLVARWRE